MADAGVARDRLPWLEPYRAPVGKKSNRKAGVTVAIGAVGLTGVLTLLMRDALPVAPELADVPQVSVSLPAPADMQPQIVLPPLETSDEAATEAPTVERAAAPRRSTTTKGRISAVPTRAAYRKVMKDQSDEPIATEPVVSQAAIAIASLPAPIPTPIVRPAVNPTAQVVRGKTVQLGVYLTQHQAEAAWRSAIRDYTYLVTMPKSIEPIAIRSKRFYRLQLGTPSKRHAQQLCGNLKSIGRACTVA